MGELLNAEYREAVEGDLPYVIDVWGRYCLDKSARQTWPQFKQAAYSVLEREDVEVRVACDPEDRDAIWGFAVVAPEGVQFVYVRRFARGSGICRRLIG